MVKLALLDLPSPSYFRVAFQKDSGSPYFGYLKNQNENWVPVKPLSSSCQDYYFISDSSTNSAVILVKIGEDIPITEGEYLLKAHRFTSTACSATAATNNRVVNISLPFPSSSPNPPTLAPTILPTHPPVSSTPKPTIKTYPTLPVLTASIITPTVAKVLSGFTTPIDTPLLAADTVPISTPQALAGQTSLLPTNMAIPNDHESSWPAVTLILFGLSITTIGGLIYISPKK